jgi:hypothetical protein
MPGEIVRQFAEYLPPLDHISLSQTNRSANAWLDESVGSAWLMHRIGTVERLAD